MACLRVTSLSCFSFLFFHLFLCLFFLVKNVSSFFPWYFFQNFFIARISISV